MADNERSELNRLQQEAIRRAREMQARAQISSSYAARTAPSEPARPSSPAEEKMPQPPLGGASVPDPGESPAETPPAPHSSGIESLLGGVTGSLDFLLKDTERSMLLILLLILLEEKADTSLIFAMMYLLI